MSKNRNIRKGANRDVVPQWVLDAMVTDLSQRYEDAGVTLPERALHTVWHFGKQYQWFRRFNGQLVMRPLSAAAAAVTVPETVIYETVPLSGKSSS